MDLPTLHREGIVGISSFKKGSQNSQTTELKGITYHAHEKKESNVKHSEAFHHAFPLSFIP